MVRTRNGRRVFLGEGVFQKVDVDEGRGRTQRSWLSCCRIFFFFAFGFLKGILVFYVRLRIRRCSM